MLGRPGWTHFDLEEMSPFEFGVYVHLYLNELKEKAREGEQ